MPTEITTGDIVQLKSGGPKMTVSQIGTGTESDVPRAWCDWFEGTKKMDGTFPLTSLKPA